MRRGFRHWLAVASAPVILLAGCTPSTEPDLPPITLESRYETPLGPVRIVSPGSARAITSGAGSIWIAAAGVEGGGGDEGTAVLRIDPATGNIVATIRTQTAPPWEDGGGGILFADGSIWVTGGGGTDGAALLQRIDIATNAVSASTTLGPTVHGTTGVDIAATDRGIWVASTGGIADWGKVTLVDPDTNLLEWQIELEGTESVRRIAATDASVVVQVDGASRFIAIDPKALEVTGRFALEDRRVGARIASHGGRVWGVTGTGDETEISPLGVTTAAPTDDGFPLDGGIPRSFLLSEGSKLWFGVARGEENAPDVLSDLSTDSGVLRTHGKTSGTAAILEGDLWTLGLDGMIRRSPLPTDSSVGQTSGIPNGS